MQEIGAKGVAAAAKYRRWMPRTLRQWLSLDHRYDGDIIEVSDICNIFSNLGLTPKQIIRPDDSGGVSTGTPPPMRKCSACGTQSTELKACSACESVYYCSAACKVGGKEHRRCQRCNDLT